MQDVEGVRRHDPHRASAGPEGVRLVHLKGDLLAVALTSLKHAGGGHLISAGRKLKGSRLPDPVGCG